MPGPIRPTGTAICASRSSARPELLFRTIMQEDRSIVDLLDADFTFVDERLARHYGIPNIHGSRMRRISLGPDDPRRGLLGQGSILTVTSAANRTSPVHARQVGAREPARRAAAATRRRASNTNLDRDPADVKVDDAAPADGAASRESGVRVVPPADGSDRVLARELRPRRQVARARRSVADRRDRVSWSTAPGSTVRLTLRRALLAGPTCLPPCRREAADLRGRTGDAAAGHAGGAGDRARARRRTTTGSRRSCSAS